MDAQAALYRSLLADKRMLVVLDNARDADQVRPILPGAPTALAVVTSRNQLAGLVAADGAQPITLDLLTPAEARELLARRLGPHRVAADPHAIANIITRCARLPLALAIVAARAVTHPHFPLATLADELRDTHHRLDALASDDPTTDTRAVFFWSYRTLTPAAARLFRLLGLHPGPDISAAAAASLAGLPPPPAWALLAELARAHLIIEHIPARYTLHDLLRAYARELAHTHDSDEQRHAASRRVLDHYLHTAHTANRLLQPHRDLITLSGPVSGVTAEEPADHGQALAWFTTEHSVLLAAVNHAATTGLDTHTWKLAWTLVTFLDRRGHWRAWAAAQGAALAAARRLADPTAQVHAHRHLAGAYTRLGRYADALIHYRHAFDLHTRSGDRLGQARGHFDLGWASARQGLHAAALHHTRQSLDLYRTAGHQRGEAQALNTLGWTHAQLGDYHQALTCCQQALTLFRILNDQVWQAATWDSLGYAHHQLGHHTQAITCYGHALDLLRGLGDRYEEADTLTRLGDTHHAAGNSDAAGTAWHHALDILDQLDHPDADQLRTKLVELNHPGPTPQP